LKIAFVYYKGRIRRLEGVKEGRVASEFFLGAVELMARGHETGLVEVDWLDRPSTWMQSAADRLFRWQLLPSRVSGPVLTAVWEKIGALREYDVIVATATPIANALGGLSAVGLLRKPVVGIHCGIVNYRHSWLRRKVNGFVLRRMWTHLYGEGELEDVREQFGARGDRVAVNQFGVDTSFWSPGETVEGGYILTVGNDARRDYELLAEAARRIPEPFVVVTSRKIDGPLPPNFEIRKGDWHAETLSDEELRSLYRGARLVVIPLKDSPQPSGQSVCLQAMACGKPVVLTDTRGLWSREMMRDGENVLLVPPGDADALVRTIQRLMEDSGERGRIGRRARETACAEGNIEGFALRLEELCRRATGCR
jgi:glycosyltransferase involved in cell wall biosynthesis